MTDSGFQAGCEKKTLRCQSGTIPAPLLKRGRAGSEAVHMKFCVEYVSHRRDQDAFGFDRDPRGLSVWTRES